MIREQTEERYRQLELLGAELGIPIPTMHLRAEINGKEVYRGRSHTWVRNFWNLMVNFIGFQAGITTDWGPGYISRKNVSGSLVGLVAGGEKLTPTGAAGNATIGLVIGTGAGAWSFESYDLTQAASMTIGTQLAPIAVYNSDTKMWTIVFQRTFNNASTDKTVTEVGLFYQGGSGSNYLLCRDVLETPVVVLIGQAITWISTLTMTFPE